MRHIILMISFIILFTPVLADEQAKAEKPSALMPDLHNCSLQVAKGWFRHMRVITWENTTGSTWRLGMDTLQRHSHEEMCINFW